MIIYKCKFCGHEFKPNDISKNKIMDLVYHVIPHVNKPILPSDALRHYDIVEII